MASCLYARLLILNSKYNILPFSYVIFPLRVGALVVIPLSLFLAYGLETFIIYLKDKKRYRPKALFSIKMVLILITICLAMIMNARVYVREIAKTCSVTEVDLKAFDWLRRNTNKEEGIDNNYGDGGLWISAILFRPTSVMHRAQSPFRKMKYVYIGKKCVYDCPLKNSRFKNNDDYELVYSEGGVYIYRKKDK